MAWKIPSKKLKKEKITLKIKLKKSPKKLTRPFKKLTTVIPQNPEKKTKNRKGKQKRKT